MADLPEPEGVLNDEERQSVAERLEERGAYDKCPRCAQEKLIVMPRLSYINLQRLDESFSGVQEQSVPVAVIFCGNCGSIQQHALGRLDLMHLAEKYDEHPE